MTAIAAVPVAPPSMQEELDRKAFEEVERLALALNQGKITNGQFASSLLSLWNTLSGLVSSNVSDIIAQARNINVGPNPAAPITTFVRTDQRGRLALVRWRAGDD